MLEEYNEDENNNKKENKSNGKRKKRKTKLRNSEEGEDQEEDESIKKIKKKKKRSKTTVKDRITYKENNDLEENEEKPKRKKRKKKKKQSPEDEEGNNSNNEENEENEEKKKKKRKKRKKPQTDDENENGENNEEENEDTKVKKRKKRKKRKEENEENNEENEEETSVKKKKKKRRKLLEEKLKENDNILESNELKYEFYKTAKNMIKKKKKKKKKENKEDNKGSENENNEDEDDVKFRTTMPLLSNKIKFKSKKENKINLIENKTKDNNDNEEENNEDEEINEDVNVNDFSNPEEDWVSIKKEFLKTVDNYLNEINLFEHIDIALVSTISLIKKEYGDFKLTKHHDIYPIKNYNNINWAKEPYRKLQDKFYELAAPGCLISKNNYLDFSNRACNEYEIYTAQVPLIKISGNNIMEIMEPQDIHFLPKEADKIIKKPYLLLFFSFEDEKSILFYKEVLEYLKENSDKFIFLPVYAPIIQATKNIYFVTEMLHRHKVYKIGDQFEIYFCSNDGLCKRFKYISNDNKRTVICKTAFIDYVNDKFVVRAIRNLDSFTFNLIDYLGNTITKTEHKKIIKNLHIFKKNSRKQLKGTSLMEPYSCNLILKKVKIYTFPISEKKLKLKYTLYDSLTGNINCNIMYKSDEKKYNNLCKKLNDLFYYKLRLNPKSLKLDNKQLNKIILEEMNKCIEANNELKYATYQSIFQTQKIIMSLGSDTNQVFQPIKSKSFKLEVHIKYKLFDELNPMTIIGSLYGLTLFSYFNNCDYIACILKVGETFPNTFNLTDHKTLENVQISLNSNPKKPTLLIIFSLAFQNYFASSELSSRFKLIIQKLSSLYEKGTINIILIYRGEPSNFTQRFEQIKDDPIFDFDFPLYIQSSADLKFPLVFQNNDIESTDSQIMTYILNKENKLVYTGNLEDIDLSKTFQKLCDDTTNQIDNIVVYKENKKFPYDKLKKIINSAISQIEKIIEEEIKKEDKLLYRPFFSLSYNSYTNFENGKTDNERYLNHIRLRILVKEKHENIFIKNPEFKNIIGKLKKYGTSTIVNAIPSEDIEFKDNCSICEKKLEIDENTPIYFDEESKKIFCEKCGEEFSLDIKNDTFITFFNTKNYTDEVILEMFENYNKRNVTINPVLGDNCKICRNKIGDCYYLNLTHFNIDYIESPLTPIDICEGCFNAMRKGDSFMNEPLKRYNYEKFGLNYKHMIYRKIYIPLTGQ